MKLFLIVTLLAYSVNANERGFIDWGFEPLTDEIINAINMLNITWKAGKNFNGSNKIEIDKLVIPQRKTDNDNFTKKTYPPDLYENIPQNFDARLVWPNCTSIGKIFDQKKGYPSWIYPSVGSIADRLCIKTGDQIDVEATVKRIIESNGGYKNNSANIVRAFDHWFKKGIFTVKSKASSCSPLSLNCQQNEFQLDKYYKVTVASHRIWSSWAIKRDIMINGPLPAYMRVSVDFPSYKSGIYGSVSIQFLGMTNVKLIGWGAENGLDYWLATNSWGNEWGDNGFYKIHKLSASFGINHPMPSATFELVNTPTDIPSSYQQDQLFYLA